MNYNNKRLFATAPLLFAAYLVYAQNSGAGLTPNLYDMSGFYNTELNGTARYVGMGGAMSALGGEISTMGTNPAGIGLYRKNDVAVTGGLAVTNNNMGNFGKEKETVGTINQAGFVWSNHVDGTSLKYFNLGFNYHKLNNFRGKTSWQGTMPGYTANNYPRTASQTALMSDGAIYSNGSQLLPLPESVYHSIQTSSNANSFYQNATNIDGVDNYLSWLTIMGIRTGLISPMYDNNNKLVYYEGYDGGTGNYYSETRGGIDSYDFNMSFNFNDRVYLGVTLAALDVNYDYYSRYSEDLYDAFDPSNPHYPENREQVGSYTLENWKKTTGNGFNVNLGLIARPIEDSPFRFGVAVKTPTWYRLTDTYSASLSTQLPVTDDKGNSTQKNSNEQTGLSFDYRFQTPWSFNLSVGNTFGNFLALDAEYEYTDYSTAKLKDADGNDGDENDYIKQQLKAVHQFKIGAEWKAAPDFAIRAGYNYISNVMKSGEEYYYTPGYTSVNTRTDFANMKNGYNLTFGFGYSGKRFYADLAYLYSCRNYDFYPFALSAQDNQGYFNMLPATKLKAERQQVLLTFGYRF